MARRKSQKVAERDLQVDKAVSGVQSGLYKSAYDAAKQLGLSKTTVTRRIHGRLTQAQARYSQQLLSPAQEDALLKWIKQLTIRGYAPTHSLVREIAEEIRSNQSRNLNDTCNDAPNSSKALPHLPLGQEWVLRFIKRHPHLKAVVGRRIDTVRMDSATKEVITTWFDAYSSIVTSQGIIAATHIIWMSLDS
jgi:hypothetical protein